MKKGLRFKIAFFSVLIFTALLRTKALAQDAEKFGMIRLVSAAIPVTANAKHWLDSMSAGNMPKDPAHVLIHFNSLPTSAEKELLSKNGITLLDYIPDNTFTALVRLPLASTTAGDLPLHSITSTVPEWKASDYVWSNVNGNSREVTILVSFYQVVDPVTIRQFVSGIGGKIVAGALEQYGNYKIKISGTKVRMLAQWYGVRFISPVTDMVPCDLQSRPAVRGNVAVAPPVYGGYGLTGDSVTVGVGDDAPGVYHADLKDRIINFNPSPTADHGEFVNGITGGAANIDPLSATIASHVSLLDYLYDLILPATGAMYRDYNMTITNNSYEVTAGNCSYAGTYDVYSELLDTLAIQYPYVQHVFASGNDGGNQCKTYPQGFGTLGGGYQPAKNNIVVGSITDFLAQAGDESRGPTNDGRIKPEIVAVGLGAYSTVDVDQYMWSAGTSMACPQVSSGLAVLTQRYKQVNGGAQPRADLLKAILLNGALDLGVPGPDYSYGFGGMNLNRSLQIIDNSRFTSSDISMGDSQLFSITVPPNMSQLKVMLYWNDVPANASAAKDLINDLDLSVTDPGAINHLPLVLDPTPANVNNPATEQADHLNNVEQVTINNPAAGTYIVKTKGYSVPFGPQHYALVYDMQPKALQLTYPRGGEQLSNVDSIRVFWDAVSDGNRFTLQVSVDNGSNWVTIADTIPANAYCADFNPLNINSGTCLVRVTRNGTGEVATSARFSISRQPVVVLDSAQCPGYANVHWAPVLNATSYYLLRKVGYYMQVVDSTTDTAYSFHGLPLNEKSYLAVQPVLAGLPGYRSVSAIVIANRGNCTNPVSAGDLMLEKLVAPTSGRMHTSTQLSANTTLQLSVRNLYNATCNLYTLSWQVNGGAWQTETVTTPVPANSVVQVSIPGLPLIDTGAYHIMVAIRNLELADPQHANDTLSFTLQNIPNDTIDLATPFEDGFETMAKLSVSHDSIGVSPNGHWDYFNAKDTGRMRTFVSDEITISGNRSISLDEQFTDAAGSKNTFVGTFNLANYDTGTAEVRVDFDYILHGTPKTADGNVVRARANDTVAWAPLYTYDLATYAGTLTHVRSVSLTDAVRLSGHNFSAGSQVSFGQNDTSIIAAVNYGNGITFDNFRLYTVANDAAIAGVVAPSAVNCGLPDTQPLIVQVHNGVNYTIYNVQLYYKEDSAGNTYSGLIDSIPAKATINYTFAQPLNTTAGVTHSVNVWLAAPGDTYTLNDSLLNYHFRNSQIVSSYPYLENFEEGDGGYYSDGFNNSWQYGTPASPKINKAASGTKAWKTNLNGVYNNLEKSYLYSPCFDISSLSNPMLSFSIALDIENCGNTLCDAAYIECSFDGQTWLKLGSNGQGTNWYDSTFDVWNTEGFTRWHVASIPLPQPGPGVTVHFRFVLAADPGVTYEGISVDDIHIFDLNNSIFSNMQTAAVTQDVSGSQWVDYVHSGQLLASLRPNGESINGAEVTLYPHDTITNPGATQYTMGHSYTIKAPQQPADSVGVRLFLLDSEVVQAIQDTTCPSCKPITDAYSLGVTQYDNLHNADAENATLIDDTGGVFTYYPYTKVQWVPYDKGYYAQLKVKPFSEFWFNNGGPTGAFAAGTDYLNFIAYKKGGGIVRTQWYSLIDTAVNTYTVEWSADSVLFGVVKDTVAQHTNPGVYTVDDPVSFSHVPVFYYRLKWTMTGRTDTFYSPIRKVDSAGGLSGLVSLNAQMASHQSVLVSWVSYIDGLTDHYLLQRSIGDGSLATIGNIISVQHFGQHYYYTDKPAGQIPVNTPIRYRLTAVLKDGTSIVLPDQTIEWQQSNALVNIYPNPTHDGSFTLHWNADAGTVMQVVVTDISGRDLYKASFTAAQWDNITALHAIDLPAGLYFVRLDIGGKRSIAKLIKE